MTGRQVIDNQDIIALLPQRFYHMAADIPCPAGDEDLLFRHWVTPENKPASLQRSKLMRFIFLLSLKPWTLTKFKAKVFTI
jgi:hypothetical protein